MEKCDMENRQCEKKLRRNVVAVIGLDNAEFKI